MPTTGQQNKRWLTISAIGLAVLLLVYYLISPWVTLARLKADAQARRTDRMERYIDFAAVRSSIKTQLLARLQEEIPADARHQGWAGVGMALAGAALEPAVYVLASPRGLVAMMNGENPLPGFDRLGIAVPQPVESSTQPELPMPPSTPPLHAVPHGPGVDATGAAREQANQPGPKDQAAVVSQAPSAAASPLPVASKRPWRLRYESLDRVVIQRQSAQAGEPYLLMQRRGWFSWLVVDVQLGRLL